MQDLKLRCAFVFLTLEVKLYKKMRKNDENIAITICWRLKKYKDRQKMNENQKIIMQKTKNTPSVSKRNPLLRKTGA